MPRSKNIARVPKLAKSEAQLRNSFEKNSLEKGFSPTAELRRVSRGLSARNKKALLRSATNLIHASRGIKKLKGLAKVKSNYLRGAPAIRFLSILGYCGPTLSKEFRVRITPYSIQISGKTYDIESIIGGQVNFYGVTLPVSKRDRKVGKLTLSKELFDDPEISMALKSITFHSPIAGIFSAFSPEERLPYHKIKRNIITHEMQHAYDLLHSRKPLNSKNRTSIELLLRSELATVGIGSSIDPIRNPSLDHLIKSLKNALPFPEILSSKSRNPVVMKAFRYYKKANTIGFRLTNRKTPKPQKVKDRQFLRSLLVEHKEDLKRHIVNTGFRGCTTTSAAEKVLNRIITGKLNPKPIGSHFGAKGEEPEYETQRMMDSTLSGLSSHAIINATSWGQKALHESGKWQRGMVDTFTKAHNISEQIMKRKLLSQHVFAAICKTTPITRLLPTLEKIAKAT